MAGYDHLIDKEIVNGPWSWNSDRALLYAVGVGAGVDDPLQELQFTTENSPGVVQQVIPSFITLMMLPSKWVELLGWTRVGLSPIGMVHGEQSFTLAGPLPVAGNAHVETKFAAVYDKGSGALVVLETRVSDANTGALFGTARSSIFAQGKGGFGGPRGPEKESVWHRPDREPDAIISFSVGRNQSLIYRLSGDRHPHGFDPGRARADGFDRPVFYGLGTYGVACRALVKALCDGDVARFGHMDARFSRPVYPGDKLDTLIWRTDDGAVFQVVANTERVALDRGVFRFIDSDK